MAAIAALGASFAYLLSQSSESGKMVEKAIAARQKDDKTSAQRPTPTEIRDVKQQSPSCWNEDINLAATHPQDVASIKASAMAAKAAVERFDAAGGVGGEPSPPTEIHGVYLELVS